MSARSSSTSAPPILLALRAALGGVHASLDEGLDLREETLDTDRYARFLRASLEALAPIERAARAWQPPIVEDVTRRARKCDALARDLAALGRETGERMGAPVALSSISHALGLAYVVEGSTLGAAVLARRVTSALGPDAPLAYLRFYGDDTGAMWRTFVEALGTRATDVDETVRGGREGFARYAEAFRRAELITAP